ncbi:kinase-like domain-containing protein [Hyaloraphidium curvatum]|nr:kinase-like domain-containing protein [Hyaloraphidium curvatum]
MADGAGSGGDSGPPPGPAPPSESRNLQTPLVLPRPASFQLDWRDIVRETDFSTGRPRKLGSGAFGVVYAAKLKRDMDTLVALKILQWSGDEGLRRKQHESFSREVEVWQTLTDDHVVPFFGFCTSPPLVVTEFCAGGNLSQFMARHDWHTHLGFRLLANAATGITFLHSKDIIHGGLKPENILIDDSFGYPVAKVSDYCMPQIFTKLATHDTFEPEFQHGEDFDIAYASPESITGERLPKASDVWSFGMVCWHVQAHGQRPYGPRPGFPIVQAIRRGQCPPRPYRTTDAVWSLIQSCWSLETERRPTMAAVTAELIRLRDT